MISSPAFTVFSIPLPANLVIGLAILPAALKPTSPRARSAAIAPTASAPITNEPVSKLKLVYGIRVSPVFFACSIFSLYSRSNKLLPVLTVSPNICVPKSLAPYPVAEFATFPPRLIAASPILPTPVPTPKNPLRSSLREASNKASPNVVGPDTLATAPIPAPRPAPTILVPPIAI